MMQTTADPQTSAWTEPATMSNNNASSGEACGDSLYFAQSVVSSHHADATEMRLPDDETAESEALARSLAMPEMGRRRCMRKRAS